MSAKLNEVRQMVLTSVRNLVDAPAFKDWFQTQRANHGDIIVINNSFIYRKPLIKTSKNSQYLCLKVKDTEPDAADVLVGQPGDLNSDFKLFSARSSNLPPREALDQALLAEMKRLGRLVFVLIGELQDLPSTVPVNHKSVKKLKFDPSAGSQDVVADADGSKTIIVDQLTDPESAWNAIKPKLEQETGDDLSSLEVAFGAAFERLQDEARLRLILPSPTASKTTTSFIARLRASVCKQRKLYEEALGEWTRGGQGADGHLREMMRIAYNFADDAIKVLKLLVSVADLKAVLLWCTIKEHFDVAEAFRNLPWKKSHKKPSLELYREIISGARNRAFHNLLAFDRTIEADLGGVDVKARRLTLLPAHGRRKSTVAFDYEDREMVEILTELTRAPEVAVPFDFWKKNADVMESFEKLLASTEDALWALNRARG
ncbi:hypothetical protein [Thermus islandicus]|uniref:hypothetical protein n=1 Tax=Thermus islandicus TaxID=540988 RepID=UPI0012EBB43A|nr:hypothetical protein [Thermus islandicus]